MTDNTDEIAALKARVAELERANKPPLEGKAMEQAVKEHMDRLHRAAEARMSRASAFSADQIAAFDAAAPRAVVEDLRRHGTVQSPSAAGSSGLTTKVSSNAGIPGSNTGWRDAPPLTSPPGVALADRLMDAQDARDRHELMLAEAKRLAMKP
jgi:hypothetical protein